MILIRYSKLKGAEFIPHLDTLRHLAKILRRANVNVKYSNGFNPHILIFMSSPIALGLKSESEYCLIDTDDSAENFKEKFNKYSLKGIRCEEVWQTEKKAKVASDITSATYEIMGVNNFDVKEFLKATTFVVTDKHSNEKEVRDKIIDLYFEGETLIAKLKFGNDTLRPDYLSQKLKEIYGGTTISIIKKSVNFANDLDTSTYLKSLNG